MTKNIEPRHYDVIVIGSGAGGGTLAGALSRKGKRVLVLERGPPRASSGTVKRHVA